MNKYIINSTDFCFDKEDFFKIVFSVDLFLRKNKQAELSIIRNDLEVYLRFLRAALIDLINQDYNDFVSLSGNLKGLDILIKSMVTPLISLKTEISHLKILLTTNLLHLENCYTKKNKIQTLRKTLLGLLKVYAYFRKLELNKSTDSVTNQDIYLEKAFIAAVQINYNKSSCPKYMKDVKHNQSNNLEKQLWVNLENYFIANIKTNSDEIKNCLRIYILLNSCYIAEDIFKKKVKSQIDNILSKYIEGKCHISIIYNKILDFIALNMKELLFVTYYTSEIKGFNFLVNSFWFEVVDRFVTLMSSLYVTGNPNVFYHNFQSNANFMLRIETMLKSRNEVQIFRQHAKTKQFEKQWNFSVYFQIRYLEIATDLEKACDENFKNITKQTSIENANLQYISVAYDCLTKCWADSSYINQLFPKYLKLTYHIFARVIKWTEYILVKQSYNEKTNKLSFLVSVYNNLSHFLKFIQDLISKIIDKNSSILLEKMLFDKSYQDSKSSIILLLKEVEQGIILNLVSSSSEYVSHVADVSRLYRKTNRDIPKKHSSYVQSILDPVDSFQKQFADKMSTEIISIIIKEYFSAITSMYYNSTEEALSSVKKTENSLKRLKIVRGKFDNDNLTSSRISDDDKIRLQLELDVNMWTTEIKKRKFQQEEIKKLYELNQLVQEATKSIKC